MDFRQILAHRRRIRGGAGTVVAAVLGGASAGAAMALALLLLIAPLLGDRPKTRRAPNRTASSSARPPARSTPPAPVTSPQLAGKPEAGAESTGPAPVPVSPTPPPRSPARLQALLETEARRLPGRAHIHVRLYGGGEAGVRADEPVAAASLIKVPLMGAVYGAWRTGFLQRTPLDEERVRKMITESDNPAADALMERVGMSQVNDWLAGQGYEGTRLRHKMTGPRREGPNLVTAREMSRMVLEIARGTLVDPAASAEMRRALLAQTRRGRLPARLPPDAVVGNKTGTLRGLVHDVAFVESPDGPHYALAVLLTGAGTEATANRAIAALSERLYGWLAP